MPPDQDDTGSPFDRSLKPAASSAAGDGRREVRVRTNWRARALLPDERIVELNVFDLAESGISLISSIALPAHSDVPVVLAVPALADNGGITPVQGTIRTTHMTIRGQDIHCGGQWVQLGNDGRELLAQWIRKLRG